MVDDSSADNRVLRAGSRSPAISASTNSRDEALHTAEATGSLDAGILRVFSSRWIDDARDWRSSVASITTWDSVLEAVNGSGWTDRRR